MAIPPFGSPPTPDASSSKKGKVQLTNDLGGTAAAPTVVATHLSAALPINQGGTGITSFGTGVATFLGTPTSANLAAALTDETGTGAAVFGTSPTLTTPTINTPTISAWDGWQPDSNTWTRVSNTQFTISSATDFSTRLKAGTYLKWQESSVQKYGTVASASFASSTTTVNLIPNTDYVMAATPDANSTYYSYAANPQGFPMWFNYTTTMVGWASPPTTIARFFTIAQFCYVNIGQASTATANSTTRSFTSPVAIGGSEPSTGFGWWTCVDNGVTLTAGGRVFINPLSFNVMGVGKDMSGAGWTASGGSRCNFAMSYGFGT